MIVSIITLIVALVAGIVSTIILIKRGDGEW